MVTRLGWRETWAVIGRVWQDAAAAGASPTKAKTEGSLSGWCPELRLRRFAALLLLDGQLRLFGLWRGRGCWGSGSRRGARLRLGWYWCHWRWLCGSGCG